MSKGTETEDRKSYRPYPRHNLQQVLHIAQAIQDKNNGKPMKRILLADAIDRSPSSSEFKYLLSSSLKYGLTTGTEKAEYIELTPLGQSITKPLTEEERREALQTAALKPELFLKIYQKYKDGKLPTGDFFNNVLEREFGVPREHVQECSKFIMDNGSFAGLLQDIQGSPYVIFGSFKEIPASTTAEEMKPKGFPEAPPIAVEGTPIPAMPIPKQIFVAHGKNRKPLDQAVKILSDYKIPHIVATEEPNSGRPIGQKVAEEMQKCTAGIFIFTADEKTTDAEGTEVWRPSDNVVYELGAGSVLYGNKIVIFKEESVGFASDFKALGYITFEKNKLDAKGLDLLRELAAMEIIKFAVT